MKTQFDILRPSDVAAYLSARGWKRGESFREDRASLWLAPGDDDADVLLPLKASFKDYTMRMGALVESVAKVEKRPRNDVLRDLCTINSDVVRVRIATGDGSATLPFIAGVRILKRVRDVIIAAALATMEKRAFFTNRRPETIHEFLGQLRLGQTEPSSYVFTVISPIDTEEGITADQEHEPFGRRVTHTLMHALSAMKQAADAAAREGTVSPFWAAVAEGVSANLCDAVVELKSILPLNEVEFSVSWASSHRPPRDTISSVVLKPDSIPYIEAAGDAFWGMPKSADFRLDGMVRALRTAKNGGAGLATLMGYVDGRQQDVRVWFESPAYAEVVKAYRKRLKVHCEGDLVREEGVLTLKNPRYFHIIDGE